MSSVRITISRFASVLTLAACGCNFSHFSTPSTASSTLPAISGTVHGGQQPVSGATIQLYAANTSVTKGPASPLISTPVLTNANGGFNITGDYTCPAPGSLVYIVATGGNPGLPGTVNNTGIALLTVLGTCGSLTSSTYVSINELTTVAGIEALAPFMTDYAHVGTVITNLAGLASAFTSATAFVDPGTGQFRTASNGVTAPIAQMNTLANILAACVNSSGGAAGSATPCGKLFTYATNGATLDTIAAMLHIVQLPNQNVTLLYNLSFSIVPFLPALTVAPTTWTLTLVVILGSSSSLDQVLTDSQGLVWVSQVQSKLVKQYDNNLNLLHTFNLADIGYGTGTFQVTLDKSDNLWVPLDNKTLLKISSIGTVLSPAAGYQMAMFPDSVAWPASIVADSLGNIWVTALRVPDATFCLVEYSSTGTLMSPASGYCGNIIDNGGPLPSQAVADSSGNVYLFYSGTPGTTQKFSTGGTVSTYPAPTYTNDGGYGEAVFDPKYQRIWAAASEQIDNLNLDTTVVSSFNSTLSNKNIESPPFNSIAVDGTGDLWIATLDGNLADLSPSGSLLSPCIAGFYGCGIPVTTVIGGLAGIAVDPSGNIFTVNTVNGTLLKVPSLAAAK